VSESEDQTTLIAPTVNVRCGGDGMTDPDKDQKSLVNVRHAVFWHPYTDTMSLPASVSKTSKINVMEIAPQGETTHAILSSVPYVPALISLPNRPWAQR
jgi:hypothetical protein